MSQTIEQPSIETIITESKTNNDYKLLAELVCHKMTGNKNERKIAKNFHILLNCINKSNNPEEKDTTIIFLRDGIKNIIEYFTQQLIQLLKGQITPDEKSINFELLNDLVLIVLQQIDYKGKNLVLLNNINTYFINL